MKKYIKNLLSKYRQNNFIKNFNSQSIFNWKNTSREYALHGVKDCLNSYTNFVYIAICCDNIVRDVTKQNYYFTDEDGKKIENDKINEKLLLPFINGYYNNDFLDILKMIIYHKLLTGNGYLKKDKISLYSSYENCYDQFIPILPQNIRPIISNDGKELLYYEQRKNDGILERLEIDEIIHFKQNTIYNPFIGIGNITKMRLLAEGDLAAQIFNNEFLTNKAFPSVIFSDETELRPGDYERITDLIQKRFKASNGKAFYVNGNNFKVNQLNPSYQDMQFLEQKRYNEETIYELFGCYKLKDTTNRATAEIKRLKYLENTINPIINEIEKTINHQYMFKQKSNKKILFKINQYKTTDVENVIKMINNGIINLNRASELLGEDFDENDINRQSFYLPVNLIPLGYENVNDDNDDENEKKIDFNNVDLNNPKNVDEIVAFTFKNSRRHKYFQTKYLRRALVTRNRIEDKFVFLLKNFFRKQKKRIIKKIINNYEEIKKINIDTKNTYDNENLDIFFSLKEEDKYIKKYINDLHEQTLENAIDDVNYLAKTNISHTSNVMNYLKESLGSSIVGLNAKNNINKYTQKKVYNIIIQSINENLTVNEIQEELNKVFISFESYRTRRIARTETRAAWDAAATETYKELDVKKVDVVGCTQFEPDSDCGKKGILLTEVLNLRFHPNHIGALAPEMEP